MYTINSSKPSVKAKKYKVVVVSWGDAFICPSDFNPKEAASTTPVYRKTVGWLIAKNKHGYVLATDTFDDSEDVSAKMFIPRGMVDSVVSLVEPLVP